MPSESYIYKSNQLRDRYNSGEIKYEEYKQSLEIIIKEVADVAYTDDYKRILIQDAYSFENKQAEEVAKAEREQKKLEYQIQRQEAEDQRFQKLSPEEQRAEKLNKRRELFFERDMPDRIDDYKKESRQFRERYNGWQSSVILGSALATCVASITIFSDQIAIKIIAAASSLLVTIAAGIMSTFKYRERSINLQKAADDLEHEHEAMKLGTHTYLGKTREDALGLFSDRILKRIKEQKDEQQILEQPPEAKQIQTTT